MATTEEIILKYTADTAGAESNVEQLGAENDQAAESVANVNDQLDEVPGAAGQAAKGVKTVQAAFKALLANPIVLLIAAVVAGLTLLFKAFTRTAGGGDTMAKVMEGLEATIGPVLDALGKLTQGIASFLSGDFQEGIDQMSGAFDGLGDAMAEAYTQAGLLVDIRRELLQMNRDLVVGESELILQMDQQRAILDDVSLSIEDRILANERLNELNKELLASRQAVLDKQLEQAELEKAQAGLDDEALQESLNRIAELTAARNNAEAERFRIEKEFVIKRNELLNIEQAQIIARAAELAELENQEFRDSETAAGERFTIRSERLKGEKIQELQIEQEFADRSLAIQKGQTDGEKALAKARLDVAKLETEGKLKLAQAAANGLTALAELSKDGSKEQKALAISAALINTYLAISGQLAAFSGVPIPGYAIVQAIATGLVGFAQVKAILGTQIPGGGGVGNPNIVRPTTQGGGIIPQNVGFQDANPDLPTDVQVINQGEQPPIRAFVMEGEITSAQEATKAADDKTTL